MASFVDRIAAAGKALTAPSAAVPALARMAAPPLELKASDARAASMYFRVGVEQYPPADYSTLVKRYASNAIVRNCVKRISEAVGMIPPTPKLGGREKDRVAEATARFLAAPNPRQDRRALMESLTGFFLLHGNGFLELVPGMSQGFAQMYTMRPEHMRIVPGADGWVQKYVFRPGTGAEKHWPVDIERGKASILHIPDFAPDDDLWGRGALKSVEKELDVYDNCFDYARALLKNGAMPSGAMKFAPQVAAGEPQPQLTEEQFQRLKQQLARQTEMGNKGKPMILEGGLDWVPFSWNLVDMQAEELRNGAARGIALGFGVPPMLLGIPGDNTYCLPMGARIETPEGAKAIGDVRPGDRVFAMGDGELRARRVLWQGKVGRKIVHEVRLSNRTLKATGNHPVLVRRDCVIEGRTESRLEYVRVDSLKRGDIAVIAHRIPVEEQPTSVPVAEMELFGFYTGDGSSAMPVAQAEGRGYRRGGSVSLAIPEGASYGDHYAAALSQAAGGAKVVQRGRARVAGSSSLARLLDQLGLTGTAHTKRVPEWVFITPLAHRLAYLRGILDSDGTVDKHGRMSLTLASEDLLRDLWHLALSCGLQLGRVTSGVRQVRLPDGEPFSQTYHSFMISRAEDVALIGTNTPEYQARIAANLGKLSKRPEHRGLSGSSIYATGGKAHREAVAALIDMRFTAYAQVISVEPLEEMDVYDIEVEGDHNFIADGVVVHNSNYKEANRAFYRGTVIPLAGKLYGAIGRWLGAWTQQRDLSLDIDEDKIYALAEELTENYQRLETSRFLTLDEKREAAGYDPLPDGLGARVMVNGFETPLDASLASAEIGVEAGALGIEAQQQQIALMDANPGYQPGKDRDKDGTSHEGGPDEGGVKKPAKKVEK